MVQYISERHRKPARRDDTDYTRAGWYFVTIVTRHRTPLFGSIVNGVEWLNEAGIAIEQTWLNLPKYVQGIRLDEFILMPNHLHGIIVIEPFSDPACQSALSEALKAFKSLSTNEYGKGVVERRWEPYDRHVWQRSYHDQIIRTLEHLDRVRTYIANNPRNWESDEEHPSRQAPTSSKK